MMEWIKSLFEREAALAVGLVTAALNVAVVFGLSLPDGAVAGLTALLVAIGAVVVRSKVYSEATHEADQGAAFHAGHDVGVEDARELAYLAAAAKDATDSR